MQDVTDQLRMALAGLFAPISTPFDLDEEVDLGALRFNMGRYAASGIHGYLALGSNGENRSLEWPHVLEAPVHGNAARRPDGHRSASWPWRRLKFGGPAVVSRSRGYERAHVHRRRHGSTVEPASVARRPACSPDTRAA